MAVMGRGFGGSAAAFGDPPDDSGFFSKVQLSQLLYKCHYSDTQGRVYPDACVLTELLPVL